MKTCDECQLCCKLLFIQVDGNDTYRLEFFRAWGLIETKGPLRSSVFEINYPCQHLGDGKCNDYENRPHLCRVQTQDILRDATCRRGCR